METIETDVILERLNNLIETNKKEHKDILEQTTLTNGRVDNLEDWKNRMIGGFVVSNAILIPLVFWLLSKIE